MKFFVARFEFNDGHWSHPWTVWAADHDEAIGRLQKTAMFDLTKDIIILERPSTEAGFYNHREGTDAREHSDIEWRSEI
ncbi:MAG: hypothetical protein J0H34_22535 [Rhizobiales bacterium]|nr:hypothetical protein [Hyphomicrobiales bacterium]